MESPRTGPDEVRTLGVRTALYGLGHVLAKGLAFLTLPLYTRFLTREEYGAYALVLTIVQGLGLLLPLGLHGALTRLHFDAREEESRLQVLWTLSMGLAAVALGLAALGEIAGTLTGWSPFRGLPYHPNLRLCLWSAFAGALVLVPMNLLQIRGKAGTYVLWSLAQSATTVGLGLLFVAVLRRGVTGAQLGTLLGSAALAAPLLLISLRHARPCWRPDLLRTAFAYCLPLAPHGLLTWVLTSSDRLILERWVPRGEIGGYLVGWQLASVVSILSAAMNSALAPHLFGMYADAGDGARPRAARIATYFALLLLWVTLGIALFSREAVALLAPAAYKDAHRIVPWIAGGMLLGGLYYLPANVLFIVSRTGWILLATFLSSATSVGLNLLLVPARGTGGAALAGLASNAVLLLVTLIAAQRRWPLPYEKGRLVRLALVTAACFAAGQSLSGVLPPGAALGARTLLWLAWPLLLAATGFLNTEERARLGRLFRKGAEAGGAPP